MKSMLISASLAAALATVAAAQTANAAGAPIAAFALPQAYGAYAQPEITDCKSNGPLQRQCVVPAMTAGRYIIEAAANATASGANATQTLAIKLGDAPCVSPPPIAFTGKGGLHLGCEAAFLTDQPITVSAVYTVANGVAEPAGPQLVIHRIPWNGLLEARALAFRDKPKAGAPAKPAAKKPQ